MLCFLVRSFRYTASYRHGYRTEGAGVGDRLACSKRSDGGERCEVKKAMKSRGGLGREVREHLSPSLAFIFSHSFLLRTAPHCLNAWNRLGIDLFG